MSAAVAGFAIAVAAVAFLALTLALTLVSLVTLVAVAVLVLATAATEACPWDDADFAGQTVRFAGRSLVFCTAFGATCPRRECGGAASEEAWLLLPFFGAADESVLLLLLLLLLLLENISLQQLIQEWYQDSPKNVLAFGHDNTAAWTCHDGP